MRKLANQKQDKSYWEYISQQISDNSFIVDGLRRYIDFQADQTTFEGIKKFVFPSSLEGRISNLTNNNDPGISHPYVKITFYNWVSQHQNVIKDISGVVTPELEETFESRIFEAPQTISNIFLAIPESSLIENFSHQWTDTLDWSIGIINLIKKAGHLAVQAAIRSRALSTIAPLLQRSAELGFAAFGYKINDLQAMSYQNLNLRSFQYIFNLIPKNDSEAETIIKMIRHIKKITTPSYKDTWVKYPAICDVSVYGGHGRMLYKTMLSGVQKFDINYAPAGYMRTFKDGSPAQYTISLDIQELRRVDQDMIDGGS